MDLIRRGDLDDQPHPGSVPLFGLNTLGGALSIRTKSGAQYPGTEAQL